MAPVNLIDHEDIAITLSDGTTPSPVTLALTMETASLSIDGLQQGGILQETTPIMRRGRLHALKRGDRVTVTGTLTGRISGIQKNELHNYVLKREAYATNVTTLGAGQKVYTIDIIVVVNEKVYDNTADDQEITLNDVHGTLAFAEEEAGVMSVTYSFTVYGEVTSRELDTPTPTAADKLQAQRA